GKILKNDLPIGNGPNEIIATFGQGVINDSLFWVYEGETMTIRFYHLFDIINNKSNADIIKKVEFDKNIFMFAFHIVPIAYDRFILTGSPLFKSKIQIINDQSEVLDTIGEFYNMNFDKLFYLKSAYLSLAEISPNHNRIINSFILEDMIEIYDIQTGKTIKVLHGPDNFRLVPEINEINKSDFFIANNDTKMASVCIFVQKQYVFLLYFGTSMIDGPSSGNQMLVIDWNGNLIKHFELSERIQDFTIDEKNHKIYAISEKGDIIYADYNIK
ncbi:MAG: BF3164 family lipoprotein, partial [Bacteroidota bacterium]|nr:BF3164 family lipoprotein [Bacteroidota bacterium]